MRIIADDLAPPVFSWIPRLGREELAAELGATLDLSVEPVFAHLAEAAAAAFALPVLIGRSALEARARRAAVHAAPDLATAELAELLGVSRSCVQHLRLGPINSSDSAAVKLQLRLRSALAAREAPFD